MQNQKLKEEVAVLNRQLSYYQELLNESIENNVVFGKTISIVKEVRKITNLLKELEIKVVESGGWRR
jgi:hypothetical protein